MIVTLNGDPCELAPGETVADALARLGLEPGRRGVAVAVDGEVMPRGSWATSALREGARVEVLSAMQGG